MHIVPAWCVHGVALTMLLSSYLYSRGTAVRCVHHIDWGGGAVLDARSCSDTVRISATETATVRPPCISRVEKVITL